jgi:MFS family permease
MTRFFEALYSIAIAAWVGGMLAIGYIAAPVLFAQLADRTMAGNLAGAMFSVTAWVGLACGSYLALFILVRKGWRAILSGIFWIVVAMLALTAAGHFGIQPVLAQLKADALPRQVMESAMRDRFAAWHGVSSIVYLVQSLLGLALVLMQEKGRQR